MASLIILSPPLVPCIHRCSPCETAPEKIIFIISIKNNLVDIYGQSKRSESNRFNLTAIQNVISSALICLLVDEHITKNSIQIELISAQFSKVITAERLLIRKQRGVSLKATAVVAGITVGTLPRGNALPTDLIYMEIDIVDRKYIIESRRYIYL